MMTVNLIALTVKLTLMSQVTMLMHSMVESGGMVVTISNITRSHWVTDTQSVVSQFDRSKLLLLCNDVETNPGPHTDAGGFERSLCEGLAKLCRAAPTEMVRSVLSVWSPSKPGNEIRSTWSQGKRFLAPALKGTLAWLTNTKESEVKGTKHEVADQLLLALEALLPDICQICKEEYTVERGVVPSLCCTGCKQGFHQACYDRLEIGDSLAELPGKFSWLCAVCAPNFTMTTIVGGRRGTDRPRLLHRKGLAAAMTTPTPDPESGDSVGSAQPEQREPEEQAPSNAATADISPTQPMPPPPPPLPQSEAATAGPVGGADGINTPNLERVCPSFMSGDCQYGISGKTGGQCPDRHPKRCPLFMRWGDRDERGCSGTTCGMVHPTLCPYSLDLRCLDRFCPWKLHTQKCQRPGGWSVAQQGRHRGWPGGGHQGFSRQGRGAYGDRFRGQRLQQEYTPLQGGWAPQNGRNYQHTGYNEGPGGRGQPQQGKVHQGAGAQVHEMPGGYQGGNSVHPWGGQQSRQAAQSGPDRSFHEMTAQQPVLGAFSMPGFQQQLQEAVAKAVITAMTAAMGAAVPARLGQVSAN